MATPEQLAREREIIARRDGGETYVEIAKDYGLTAVRIRAIDLKGRGRVYCPTCGRPT